MICELKFDLVLATRLAEILVETGYLAKDRAEDHDEIEVGLQHLLDDCFERKMGPLAEFLAAERRAKVRPPGCRQ